MCLQYIGILLGSGGSKTANGQTKLSGFRAFNAPGTKGGLGLLGVSSVPSSLWTETKINKLRFKYSLKY